MLSNSIACFVLIIFPNDFFFVRKNIYFYISNLFILLKSKNVYAIFPNDIKPFHMIDWITLHIFIKKNLKKKKK